MLFWANRFLCRLKLEFVHFRILDESNEFSLSSCKLLSVTENSKNSREDENDVEYRSVSCYMPPYSRILSYVISAEKNDANSLLHTHFVHIVSRV